MTLDAMLTPPEPTYLSFRVAGIPAPQGSLRAFARPDGGRPIVTGDNARTRPWKAAVTAAAAEARRETFTGAVSVVLVFRLPRPAGHYGTGRNRAFVRPGAPRSPTGRPDLDKLSRACLDALTEAGIWRDDAQVVSLSATKIFAAGDETPGLSVTIEEVAP